MPFRQKLKAALTGRPRSNSPPVPPPKPNAYDEMPIASPPRAVHRVPYESSAPSPSQQTVTRRPLSQVMRGPSPMAPSDQHLSESMMNQTGFEPVMIPLPARNTNHGTTELPSDDTTTNPPHHLGQSNAASYGTSNNLLVTETAASSSLDAPIANLNLSTPPSASALRISGDRSRTSSLSPQVRKRLSGTVTPQRIVAAPIQQSVGVPQGHAASAHLLPSTARFPQDPISGGIDYSALNSRNTSMAMADRELASHSAAAPIGGSSRADAGTSVMERGRPINDSYNGAAADDHRSHKPPSASANHLTGSSTGMGVSPVETRPRRNSSLRRKPVAGFIDVSQQGKPSLSENTPNSRSVHPALGNPAQGYSDGMSPAADQNRQPPNEPSYSGEDEFQRASELAAYKAKFQRDRDTALANSTKTTEDPVDASGNARQFDSTTNTEDMERTVVYAPPVVHETIHKHVHHVTKEIVNREIHLYDNLIRKQPVIVQNEAQVEELLKEPIKVHVLH